MIPAIYNEKIWKIYKIYESDILDGKNKSKSKSCTKTSFKLPNQ